MLKSTLAIGIKVNLAAIFFICLVKLNLLIVRTFLKSKVYKTLMDMDSSVVIARERGVQEDQMVMETKQ